jgi:hypothetical protein
MLDHADWSVARGPRAAAIRAVLTCASMLILDASAGRAQDPNRPDQRRYDRTTRRAGNRLATPAGE